VPRPTLRGVPSIPEQAATEGVAPGPSDLADEGMPVNAAPVIAEPATSMWGADPIAGDPKLAASVQEVMSHLLFHQSLIDEDDSGGKIAGYMEMVRGLQEGAHVAIDDPFEKSIAITLELVLTEHLNPWDVNLVEFSKLYLKRVRKEEEIDLITAGRLMLMAWSVLRLQTEEVLAALEKVAQNGNGEVAEWLEEAPEWAGYDEPDYEYTKGVLQKDLMPLEERIRRSQPRAVTLLELVKAFEEAKRETELRKDLEEQRKAARERFAQERDLRVSRMMHKESLEEDIVETWARILTHNGDPIPLDQLHSDGVEDFLTVFVAALFLALHGRIKLWQKKFPMGTIYVQKIKGGELKEELAAAQAFDAKKAAAAAVPAATRKSHAPHADKPGPGAVPKLATAEAEPEVAILQVMPQVAPQVQMMELGGPMPPGPMGL